MAEGRPIAASLWPPLIVLGLLAAAPFLGTIAHELVWDDRPLVELAQRAENLHVVATTEYVFGDHPSQRSGIYRPVVLLSLWLDGKVGGGRPASFHATNVGLHVLNALLVFALLRLLIPTSGAAFWGAAVFAVHPVHTESVAWVSGRSDLLASVGVLASAILWLRDRQGRSSHPIAERVVGGLALAFAAFAKETAVVLPAVLLFWEALAPLPAGGGRGSRARRVGGWLLAWAAAPATLLLARVALGVDVLRTLGFRAVTETGAGESGTGLFFGIGLTYLRLLLVPFPATPWYTSSGVRPTGVAVAAALLLAFLFWLASHKASGRVGGLAAVWLSLFLAPPIVSRVGVVLAERHLYLPSVALALVVGALCLRISETAPSRRCVTRAVLGMLLIAGCAASWYNSRVWQSDLTLFRQMTVTAPEAAVGHGNYGSALFQAGRKEEALASIRRAVALSPHDLGLNYNLGIAWESLGNKEQAIGAYRTVLQLSPAHVEAGRRLAQLSGSR